MKNLKKLLSIAVVSLLTSISLLGNSMVAKAATVEVSELDRINSAITNYILLGGPGTSYDYFFILNYSRSMPVKSYTSPNSSVAYSLSCNTNGQVTSVTSTIPGFGINTAKYYSYDELGRITCESESSTMTKPIYWENDSGQSGAVMENTASSTSYIYTCDSNGRALSAIEVYTNKNGVSTTCREYFFTYDNLGRITDLTFTVPDWDEPIVREISYDGITNTFSIMGDVYTLNETGQILSYSDGKYVTSYTYNPNGTLHSYTSKFNSKNTIVFEY